MKWLPAPESQLDVGGLVSQLAGSEADFSWPIVPQAWPYQTEIDPAVFAAFAAIEHRGVDRYWLVRGLLANTQGEGVVARQVTVEPYDPESIGFGVTGAAMRDIRFREIIEKALASLDLLGRVAQNDALSRAMFHDEEKATAAQQAGDMARDRETRRGGRPSLPDEHYERIARTYLQLHKEGVRNGILNEIALRESERTGRPVKSRTVRDWVQRARDLRYLERGKQGRLTAVPGERLRKQQRKEGNDG